jgi:hypothetical protein
MVVNFGLQIEASIDGVPVPLETIDDVERLFEFARQYFALTSLTRETVGARRCLHCGGSFTPRTRKTKYCTPKCRERANNLRMNAKAKEARLSRRTPEHRQYIEKRLEE